MKMLWSGWKSASMMTESLPLILTGLNSGAGGAVRPEEAAGAAWPAGLPASAGLAAAGAVVAAGAAAGAAGLGASVGLAAAAGAAGAVVAAGAAGAAVGLAGAAGWPPHAARMGRAAMASPIRTAARRERRRPTNPGAAMPAVGSRIRTL